MDFMPANMFHFPVIPLEREKGTRVLAKTFGPHTKVNAYFKLTSFEEVPRALHICLMLHQNSIQFSLRIFLFYCIMDLISLFYIFPDAISDFKKMYLKSSFHARTICIKLHTAPTSHTFE